MSKMTAFRNIAFGHEGILQGESHNKTGLGSMANYTVILEGGSPWGFRLQGGKDLDEPVKIAKVYPVPRHSQHIEEDILEITNKKAVSEPDCLGVYVNILKRTEEFCSMVNVFEVLLARWNGDFE